MNLSEYKKYHESFMENNNGSNAIHTFSSILFSVLCALICCLQVKLSLKFRYVYEYIIIALPLILGHTIFAGYVYYLNSVLSVIIFAIFVRQGVKSDVLKQLNQPNTYKSKKIFSISCLRGLTYLITVYCILAVDFRIFPRFLAKTERYGYSLMDTGVGLFVLISGLVHKDTNNFRTILKDNTKLVTILLMLGASRFFAVKLFDYQEHVTEYGVHWNFFYTLAVSKTLSSLCLYFMNGKNIFAISILMNIFHEFLLNIGLQGWVFSDVSRDTFLNSNREGISSCLGYVSLYLFAVYLKTKLTDNTVLRKYVLLRLLLMSVSFWFLTVVINSYRPISRTLTNLSYCIFLEAVVLSVILVLYIFEMIFQCNKNFSEPLVISAINYNGLLYFLFANIMTGLVNITIRTLFVSTHMSILILNVYMIVGLYFVIFLQRKRIKV